VTVTVVTVPAMPRKALCGIAGTVTTSLQPSTTTEESVAAGAQAVFDYAHATVRDEDYRLVAGLQANLESGARDHLLFGRNEPGLQHRHISWASWHPAGTSSAVG
jgi:carnitine monooxygenase subunit